jgi:hypothetical protein
MNKIVLTLTLLGLSQSSLQLNAMQHQPAPQNSWTFIRPILAGASLLGGTFSTGFGLYKLRNLKKPTPQQISQESLTPLVAPIKRTVRIMPPPEKENPRAQQLEQNIAHFEAIESAVSAENGSFAKRKQQIQESLSKIPSTFVTSKGKTKKSLEGYLEQPNFAALKVVFKQSKKERDQLFESTPDIPTQNAISAADFIEDVVSEKERLFDEYVDSQLKYIQFQEAIQEKQAQQEYDKELLRYNHEVALQKHQQQNEAPQREFRAQEQKYKKAVKRNRMLVGAGVGLIGVGGALLWLHKKK